jgi:hypothetical protein
MTRLSIFNDLKNWNRLLIHHLLDAMHIIKNICKAIFYHIIGGRDTENIRLDLKAVNSKEELWD